MNFDSFLVELPSKEIVAKVPVKCVLPTAPGESLAKPAQKQLAEQLTKTLGQRATITFGSD